MEILKDPCRPDENLQHALLVWPQRELLRSQEMAS